MLVALALLALATPSAPPSEISAAMQWRCIGPFRGGRTVGACGVPGQPNTFFIGVNNGGVWKTTDAGRTWDPIFDDQPTGSIGDVVVSPSNPNVIYVGSGEGLQRPDLSTGDGMYKSVDGGKTWEHLGLRDALQIGGLAVDAKNPNRVFVAALGHPYGANETRGVYRSLDGGKSWGRSLYIDQDTGAIQVAIDPKNPEVVYADMWQARLAPWENGVWQGDGSGLYKSTNGGDSWRKLGGGLPTPEQGLGRIGFAIAPSSPRVLYATVDAGSLGGLYKSTDAGETWALVNKEGRMISRGSDFAEVQVDPKNPDIVYVADTSLYKSTDGGVNFVCIKGSPGGDDYHRLWINPDHPEILLLAADQGAAVSVNGGATWSSWYNQPTAQFYHVATDNRFPYWVYGGQQESGSAGVSSRGNDGQITFREWRTVGADEYAYVAPDPKDPNLIYGGKGSKYHWDTGEVEFIGPDRAKFGLRFLRTSPIFFSPHNPNELYIAAQYLMKTSDDGKTWAKVSPDLSRPQPAPPANIGVYRSPELDKMPRRGVIYAVSQSPVNKNVFWCGTDDGLIHVTRDNCKTWTDVTPPQCSPWSKVSQLDASHFDDKTVYAAINSIRLDDQRPHILVTRDSGKTWSEIVSGLPSGPVNTVKEDPQARGLLFCGTEIAVFYSADDGAHWAPLRNNMPATSIRDLVIKDNDVVVGTHGRSFWILDNMSALREVAQGKGPAAFDRPYLFGPPTAYQLLRNAGTDTPLPPEEPHGKNPPDGATIDYWLPKTATRVTLECVDSAGVVVRKFASDDVLKPVDPKSITVMIEWARPPQPLLATSGPHRFIWNLRKPNPARGGLPISAIWGDTPLEPEGDWVKPGRYTLRLTVDGVTLERSIDVKADPRKKK